MSTDGQTTTNQLREIEGAGFKVERGGVLSEIISGSSAIGQRPGFLRLLDKLEQDERAEPNQKINGKVREHSAANVAQVPADIRRGAYFCPANNRSSP